MPVVFSGLYIKRGSFDIAILWNWPLQYQTGLCRAVFSKLRLPQNGSEKSTHFRRVSQKTLPQIALQKRPNFVGKWNIQGWKLYPIWVELGQGIGHFSLRLYIPLKLPKGFQNAPDQSVLPPDFYLGFQTWYILTLLYSSVVGPGGNGGLQHGKTWPQLHCKPDAPEAGRSRPM